MLLNQVHGELMLYCTKYDTQNKKNITMTNYYVELKLELMWNKNQNELEV